METNELVTKLCWMKAYSGQLFYPPEETAMECTQSLIDELDRPSISKQERILYRGVGEHSHAWTEAVDFFETLDSCGFDPVYRAEYYAEQNDLEPIDWSWLENTSFDVKI